MQASLFYKNSGSSEINCILNENQFYNSFHLFQAVTQSFTTQLLFTSFLSVLYHRLTFIRSERHHCRQLYTVSGFFYGYSFVGILITNTAQDLRILLNTTFGNAQFYQHQTKFSQTILFANVFFFTHFHH